MTDLKDTYRRNFIKFLLASPLLKFGGLAFAQEGGKFDPDIEFLLSVKKLLIEKPEEALDVFDLEAVARNTLPPAHYGYIATGVSDELSQIANRDAYKKIRLKARRLMAMKDIDTSVEIFGRKWASPVVIAPTGSHQAFHPDGELAVARAAKEKDQLMILSTAASTPIEEVVEARGEPVWSQLYAGADWDETLKIIKRAENTDAPVIVMTVDLVGGGFRETVERFKRLDYRDCSTCHGEGGRNGLKPMYEGLDLEAYRGGDQVFDWDLVKRVRDATDMKLVIKGISHEEDAKLCLRNGVDGIMVSNHGGRAQVSARGTIEVLPEVIKAVKGRIPVLVDGGIRRGEDVFKALALGATAIDIGRPYLWGLGSFGQAGVERVLELLDTELRIVMTQMGTASIDQINEKSLDIKS
ncbi:MAG: alpha-hydroxy-acid oxidizing protein [Kordiimonadaceae bacterium]|jgi:4-hydroxymandelate oxidase|nr:alpha-hydroxy-acid oxidizing protein [Kordiimonadaceae bacterium]MBT6036571.1 alpha-hydroxy-acid oxidizing protein [Kordiimonadaceae bacterium]MBT6330032.1 alpha-hydroxy-acid oxidizing protein [Kordiimonadaceae bacterium]MBT7583170.1 alpha-hydroxy-acid oxidizing protein [Kordiimonadaceae bacterium]